MIVGHSLACDGKNITRIKREEIAQQGGAVKHNLSAKSGNKYSIL